jgi:hypothetical protein
MALDAADHADIMKLSLEERVAQRVKDVKTMTKRPYAPAADPLPPKSSENRFAAPTNSFALGSAERTRRRKPRAKATNDLNDVWASLDQLNEADDVDALDGVTLDEDLCAAFDAAAKIADDDEYDWSAGATSFAELAVEKLEFGVSLLPEASLENDAGPYRDQEPILNSSDDESSEDDAPPEIDEVLEEERAEAEAFRNRRLGEAPPVVARGKGKLKPKASPTCVADFADLESGETLDVAKLEEACEKEIVYPRNPNRMKDEEATKRGEAIAKHYRAQMERKEAKEQRRRTRAMRGRVLGEDEADTSSSEDDGALREPIPPGAFDHGGASPQNAEPRRSPFPAWDDSKNVAENLDACLARLRVAAPLGDADVEGSAGAALVNELPPDLDGEGAFNPALGALADDGGAFAD